VLDVLGRWGILDAEPVAAIELMVSELVTNAVVHGRPPVILECETRGDDFVIRVYDGSTAPIDVCADCPDAAAERGRGLAIVKALAKKSRIDVGASGTTATASLSL
jgi:anti-sigma regulatory factor (Ser/Thr protein kinase)